MSTLQKGMEKGMKNIVRHMHSAGQTAEVISQTIGLPIETVQAMLDEDVTQASG